VSPLIYSTGDPNNPVKIEQLNGEPAEAAKDGAGNCSASVSNCLSGYKYRSFRIARPILKRLGAPDDLIDELFAAVRAKETGVGIAFDTIFSEPGATIGPRSYENFRHMKRKEG